MSFSFQVLLCYQPFLYLLESSLSASPWLMIPCLFEHVLTLFQYLDSPIYIWFLKYNPFALSSGALLGAFVLSGAYHKTTLCLMGS